MNTNSMRFLIITFILFQHLSIQSVYSADEQNCAKAITILQELGKRGHLFSIEEKEEKYNEALRLCSKVSGIFHNYGVFLDSQNKTNEARQQFEKALELEDKLEYRIAIARTYLAEKSYSKADQQFRAILANDPNNVKALQGLSVVAEKTGELDKAIDYLSKAADEDPRDVLTQFNLAAIYDRKGMYSEAIVHYGRAIDADPLHYLSLLHYGILLLKQGETTAGIRILEQAARTPDASSDSRAFSALGAGYERQANLPKAEISLRKALSYNESDSVTRANLALVLVRLDRSDQALELLDEHPKTDADKEPSVNSQQRTFDHKNGLFLMDYARGLAEMRLGRYDKSEAALREAIKIKPGDPLVTGALADLFEQSGDKNRAKELRNKLGS